MDYFTTVQISIKFNFDKDNIFARLNMLRMKFVGET